MFGDHGAHKHNKVEIMKATRIGIVALVVAGAFGACWAGHERRARSGGRLNVAGHRNQVGLSFRHARNDMAGFVLKGPVMVTPTEEVAK